MGPEKQEAQYSSQRVVAERTRVVTGERDIERTTSRRLAVFPGPFTVQAASAVCAEPEAEPRRWQQVLFVLTAKQLLEPLTLSGGEERFRQADVIRLAELGHLRRAGEWDLVHERLVGWLMRLAAPEAGPVVPPRASRESVHRDRDAFLAGVQWALARGDGRASLLATSLSRSWWDCGRTAQARDLLAAVTSIFDQPNAWVGAAEGQAARFAFHAGEYQQALEFAERCAQTEQVLARPVRRGRALAVAGWSYLELGDPIAGRARCEESHQVLRSARRHDLRRALLPDVIQSLILLGDLDEATSLLAVAGDLEQMDATARPWRARMAFLSGQIALEGADPVLAGAAFASALRSGLDRPSSAWLLTGLTISASLRGDHSRTLFWAAAARTRCLAIGVRPGQWWRQKFTTAVAWAQNALSPAQQSVARAAGEEFNFQEVAEFLRDQRANDLDSSIGDTQRLVRRERDIAVKLADGLTNSQISILLGISSRAR